MPGFISKTISMYVDGFRSMTVGRKLWMLIIAKLVLFFLVMKLFFFPDILSANFDTDEQRADAVRSALTTPALQPTKTH